MTCREKLELEHPELSGPRYAGGCVECPSDYEYLDDPIDELCGGAENCRKCWNREIPETPTEEKTLNEQRAEQGLDPVTEVSFTDRHMLDSCDRTQFESGAVRDMQEGKGRCDFAPIEVVSHMIDFEGDPILDCIAVFQKTRDSRHLYDALNTFTAAFHNQMETLILEVAKHFEEGAKKYGECNWQKGIPVKCYIDSAIRHYIKWLRGDKDEPHNRAFCWNLMCCIWEVDYSPRAEKEDSK